MAHSSTFLRGQASIVEWLTKGLAQVHGLKIVLPADWKGPEHMNPDQRALSNFNQEDYINLFMENVQFQALTHNESTSQEAVFKRLKNMEDSQIYALTDPKFSFKSMEDNQINASTNAFILDCSQGMEQVKNTLESSFYLQSVHLKNCHSNEIEELTKLLENQDLLERLRITDSEDSSFLEHLPAKLLQKLNELSLQYNKITSDALQDFMLSYSLYLKNLKHLDLSHNQITKTESFVFLEKSLESLDLSYNRINKEEAKNLIGLPFQLVNLDLSFNLFSPEAINEIKKSITGKKVLMNIILKESGERP